MKMEQSVPKRRHIKFTRRGITQKKTYGTRRKFEIKNTFYLVPEQEPPFLYKGKNERA